MYLAGNLLVVVVGEKIVIRYEDVDAIVLCRKHHARIRNAERIFGNWWSKSLAPQVDDGRTDENVQSCTTREHQKAVVEVPKR